MTSGAKLQKSFEDYFRIPILLKPLGGASMQTINKICATLNQIDRFSIHEASKSQSALIEQPLIKKLKKSTLFPKLENLLQNRNHEQSQKLLFLSQDFYNQWSQFQIVYQVYFIILIYEAQEYQQQVSQKQRQWTLNEKILKIKAKLKDKNKYLLGIIFLNDAQQFSKNPIPDLKFTILPPNLPLQQLSIFIQPWLEDLIPSIQLHLLFQILECREQQNSIIVFNRSEQKSEPKVMKKKKKFRCIKLCGDFALILHLYQYAYQCYHEAEEQLRKVDDYLWALGCVQGKLACMTCNAQLNIQTENLDEKIEQLIAQSFNYSKKMKYPSFEIQNFFKIIKLLTEDKLRFDQMMETFLMNLKGLTQQQKFIFYSYIGSLYQKASMERKRNLYYFKASLITENYKPQLSELLLKTIISSASLKKWEFLHSKVLQKIIELEKYFNKFGELHLQLIQQCSSVLSQKQIKQALDYLNFGAYEKSVLYRAELIEIKELTIEESLVKPKPNRLMNDQSPKKSSTGIFMGWKKKQNWLYEEDQPIKFNGTIINKLPFELQVKVNIQLQNSGHKIPEFRLILPALHPHKFSNFFPCQFSDQVVTIKRIRFSIFNFQLEKFVQPEINFQLYEKQPIFNLKVEGGQQSMDEQGKQKIRIELEQTSQFNLVCSLTKTNKVECQKIRVTFAVYYDIDVGFQQNQYNLSTENNFYDINFNSVDHKANIKFIESNQKQNFCGYDKESEILICKVKKFKASRDHIKRIEISLDYIRSKNSKYQINKIYTLETKIMNSIWGQITQISTPYLDKIKKRIHNPTLLEIQQLQRNWNIIQDFYLATVKFYKDSHNLRPFKIEYNENNDICSQYKQVILSNLTEGEMEIKLPKVKITTAERLKILSQNIQDQTQKAQLQAVNLKPLSFKWQNIVNPNMFGFLKLKQRVCSLIFNPKIDIHVDIVKAQHQEQTNQGLYELKYSIKGQVKPHTIKILQSSYAQQQNAMILVKGKTKVSKIPLLQMDEKCNQRKFTNLLHLKVIRIKNQIIQSNKLRISVCIQFLQKYFGKWERIVQLQ